jgi:hypothetical protein
VQVGCRGASAIELRPSVAPGCGRAGVELTEIKSSLLTSLRMSRLAKLQLVGPAMLFVAVLAAEAATSALAHVPSSQGLWYINLRLFGIFQKSHDVLSAFVNAEYFQLFYIALPLFFAACCGVALKRPLLLAIASNLSLIYAIFLPCCWYVYERLPQQASLVFMSTPSGADYSLCLVLLVSCMLSFGVSHVVYFQALRGR